MLTGRFSMVKDSDSVRFKVLTMVFDDGTSLVVNDPKKLVTVKLNPIPSTVPDALEVNGTYLRRKISERPRTLAKAFLIDQAIIRGIGNAYADEILWQARISPKSAVGKIPDHVIEELLASISSVLTWAVQEIKRESPQIISGEVRNFLHVHQPKRSESPTGHRIIKAKVASRPTYFTAEQVLYI